MHVRSDRHANRISEPSPRREPPSVINGRRAFLRIDFDPVVRLPDTVSSFCLFLVYIFYAQDASSTAVHGQNLLRIRLARHSLS